LLHDHASVDLLPAEMKTGKFVARDMRLAIAGGIVWVVLLGLIYVLLAGWSQASVFEANKLKRQLKATEETNKEYFALDAQIRDMEAKQRSLNSVVGQMQVSVPVMAWITRLVPDNIQLRSFSLSSEKNVKMTGVVSGEPFLLDINLSQFLIDLEQSPAFQQVQLVNKTRNTLQGETVLEFEVQCVTE
jgi:Tfp pilus assembly protein PilN